MSDQQGPAARAVVVHRKQRVFDGFFKIDEVEVSHSKISGAGMVEHATRLVFERGDAAAALIHDTERDCVILTEQFRSATFEKGPGWMLEPVAGMIEAGETPEETIRREMMEELGYEAGRLDFIAKFYVSPGGTSERIFLYYAPVTPVHLKDANAAGVASEQEDIGRVEMPRAAFLQHCLGGKCEDAKLLIAGLWLAQRRAGA